MHLYISLSDLLSESYGKHALCSLLRLDLCHTLFPNVTLLRSFLHIQSKNQRRKFVRLCSKMSLSKRNLIDYENHLQRICSFTIGRFYLFISVIFHKCAMIMGKIYNYCLVNRSLIYKNICTDLIITEPTSIFEKKASNCRQPPINQHI